MTPFMAPMRHLEAAGYTCWPRADGDGFITQYPGWEPVWLRADGTVGDLSTGQRPGGITWMFKRVRFVVAGSFWSWFLRRNSFWAIPMPWRTVYCLPEYIDDPVMQGHEMVHFEQMDREGTIRWCIKYLWYAWRLGYADNPYEREAYARFSY